VNRNNFLRHALMSGSSMTGAGSPVEAVENQTAGWLARARKLAEPDEHN